MQWSNMECLIVYHEVISDGVAPKKTNRMKGSRKGLKLFKVARNHMHHHGGVETIGMEYKL